MLTERQIKLIEAIINEYINTSEPVGSVELVDRYNLKFSAATVRNEMARLIEMGFLQMLHASSGRVPTKSAYRFYLTDLMDEEEIPVLQEVAMKQRLWPSRYQFERLLKDAAIALSEMTNYLVIASTSDGYITNAGASNVLENREFWDIDAAKAALQLLDDRELFENILSSVPQTTEVKCLIEDEIGIEKLANCAIVYADYKTPNKSGNIAVLGPSRMRYHQVVPDVRYTKSVIEELGGAW